MCFLRLQKFVVSAFFHYKVFGLCFLELYSCVVSASLRLQKFVVCFSDIFSCPSLCVATWGYSSVFLRS